MPFARPPCRVLGCSRAGAEAPVGEEAPPTCTCRADAEPTQDPTCLSCRECALDRCSGVRIGTDAHSWGRFPRSVR